MDTKLGRTICDKEGIFGLSFGIGKNGWKWVSQSYQCKCGEEVVEPLFDFDDTKTLLLWFLIKLLSVLKNESNP